VVARWQLLALGLGHGAIDHRVARGLLHPVHRGVYAVGHAVLSRHGVWMAAVLAAGPNAVLSHRSAAALWGIRDGGGRDVDVTVARDRKRPGIRAHRAALAPDEITIEDGIPVTTPARTLLDLAEQLTPQRLERAVHEAEYRRLTSPLTVDALWPHQRLVVELDSRQAHQTTRAFEHDRARDRDLLVWGYSVLRITWRQLHEDQATIATRLRHVLTTDTVRAP
jgi:very-short-patch-repair endonuclease